MHRLWKHVIPATLMLACDSEPVAVQLFLPLMKQTLHWFTRRPVSDKDPVIADCAIFSGSIFQGLCHPTDTALRELCASLLPEMLKWYMKYSGESGLSNEVRILLKNIYNLALHPSPCNRLGAAVAINAIYREFREHPALVDCYIIEMVVVMIQSLKRAHRDEKGFGTLSYAAQSIKHLQRILLKVRKTLEDEQPNRAIPVGWKDKPTLASLLRWLFEACGSIETEARHCCMTLFSALHQDRESQTMYLNQCMQNQLLVTSFEHMQFPYPQER